MKNATVRKMKGTNLLMAVAVIGLAFASASEAALLSEYTFDTDARDATGLRNGLLVGSAAIANGGGMVGSGWLKLDGAYGAVALAPGLAVLNNLTNWSIATWVKVDNGTNPGGGADAIFGTPVWDAAHPNLYYRTDVAPSRVDVPQDRPVSWVVGNVSTTNVPAVPTGWFHVALTGQGANLALYINGVLESTATTGVAANFADSVGPAIGDDNSGGRYFTGGIDEFRIYDNTLTASEVLALATVPEPASLVLVALGGLLVWRRSYLSGHCGATGG